MQCQTTPYYCSAAFIGEGSLSNVLILGSNSYLYLQLGLHNHFHFKSFGLVFFHFFPLKLLVTLLDLIIQAEIFHAGCVPKASFP